MGSKQSRSDKATSPYSSWGSSLDDLLCGPGKICGDKWTPLSTRSNSPTSLRNSRESKLIKNRRRVRSATSHQPSRTGQAEIFTVNRKYSYDNSTDLYIHQPLPSEIVSSPLNDISSVYKKGGNDYHYTNMRKPLLATSNKVSSYHSEDVPVHSRSARTSLYSLKEPLNKNNKKRKKNKISNRNSLPTQPPQPIQIFIDLNGTQQHLKLDRNNRATMQIVPSQAVFEKPRTQRNVTKSSSPVRNRVSTKPLKRMHSVEVSNMERRPVSDLRKPRITQYKKKHKAKSIDSQPFSKPIQSASGASSSTVSNRRVIPPRDKLHETPPQPFRIKSLPDKPFTRIPTAAKNILR